MNRENLAVPRHFVLPLVAVLSFATGCDTTSANDAKLQIQLTDAPSDYVQSAEIWVSRVYLQGHDRGEDKHEHVFEGDDEHHVASVSEAKDSVKDDDEDDDGKSKGPADRVDLFNDPAHPFHVDLLKLQAGVVANLTKPVDVTTGMYHELYVVVDSAFVTLKPPYKFPNGTSTMGLKLVAGSRKAIKVELAEPLDLASGLSTVVLVDFNVDRTFSVIVNGTGIKKVMFSPKLKEKHRTEHGK